MGKSKTSFVFFVGDEGTIISQMVGNQVEKKLFCTATTDDAVATLKDLLRKSPKASISMLLDSLDQSYQTQSFPPVAKMSVQKLVKARMERDFAPGDLTGYLPLGKEKSGRQDWKFLLISVVASPQFMQWLDFILELDNPFEGLFLLPVESETFIGELAKKDKKKKDDSQALWHMLVLHNKASGFRQIVTRKGRLTFTRLTQPSPGENVPLVIAGNIEQEIASTVEYLKRLSYREDEGLDITVISSPEIVEAIDADKIGAHNESNFYTPTQAASAVSLPEESFADGHFADVILSAFFASSKKRILPLQTELSTALTKMRIFVKLAKYAPMALGVLFLLISAYFAYAWYGNFSSEEPIEDSIRRNQTEVAALKEKTTLLPDDIEKMQDTLGMHQKFSVQPHHPLNFVRSFIDVRSPNILVEKIDWDSGILFKDRAKQENEKVTIRSDITFLGEAETAEKRINGINEYLTVLRLKFPEYNIEISKIQGTLYENDILNVDFTNPESQLLAKLPIPVTLTFELLPPQEEASR